MKQITNLNQLNQRIAELESERIQAEKSMKSEINTIYEGLKPMNLIKSTFKSVTSIPDLKGSIFNTILSYATGFAAKKVVVGSSPSPVKQFLGMVLQSGVTSLVSSKANGIASFVTGFFKPKPKQEHL